MHSLLNRRLRAVSSSVAILLLASCATAPTYEPQPAEVETRDVVRQKTPEQDAPSPSLNPEIETEGLKVEDLNSSRARYYQQQSEQHSDESDRINNALSSAEYYIQANDFRNAERIAFDLKDTATDPVQTDRLRVILAYVAYSQQDYQQSLNQLEPLLIESPQPSIDEQLDLGLAPAQKLSIQQVDALLLASFAHQKTGDYNMAVHSLIRRESALAGAARSETTRYIWQVISAVPIADRQTIIENSQYPLVKNRFEQSLDNRVANTSQAPQQFGQWREDLDPALKQTVTSGWTNNSARSIAVLLPISSKFSKAAQAVKEGIAYQHAQNSSTYRPEIRFYDIGSNAYQASQYYAAAIQSGADFVIGPLGKDFANQVNSFGGSRIPTLLLGGDSQLIPGMLRFNMGPETEGQRVAERAWKDGHLSAALLVPDNANSRRTANAFTQRWLQYGGKVGKMSTYSPKQYDHSVELRQLFAINQSQYRYNNISKVLGYKPKYSPYQRADIDFIFMIANNKSGRLLRPQINFFSGSSIPVYATSSIFNGLHDPVNNIDLDSTRFPVMPWVLKSTNVAPYAGQLNMLFAMGSDAYKLAGNYYALRRNPAAALNGNTGQLSINEQGEAIYQPVWARFRDGEARADETLGIDITPLQAPNRPDGFNRDVKGVYNDETWNRNDAQPKTTGDRSTRGETGG